jgi:hypothetical protein
VRHAFKKFRALRLAAFAGAADGIDQFRRTQGDHGRLAASQAGRDGGSGCVEKDHPAVAVKHDGRSGQTADQGLDQRVLR